MRSWIGRGRRAVVVVMLTGAGPGVAAQEAMDLSRARFTGGEHRMENYLGREALSLQNGTAWLDDVELEDLVIELDIAVPDAFSFMGIRFRAVDGQNHEYYYIRPHQAGRPDATQYMPIINGLGSWQINAGPDFSAPLTFAYDRWMHMKLVIVGTRMEVYLDSAEPVQVVPRLVREPTSGAVGLNSSIVVTRFANVVIRPADASDLYQGAVMGVVDEDEVERARNRLPPRERLVSTWRVSSPFPEERVAGALRLDPDDWSGLTWSELDVEAEGIANLARVHGNADGNTVFASVTVSSDRARTVPVRFGFSDRVIVFLNGTPLYAGADEWDSRDTRFLGTVGLFDTVYLPLDAGDNQLWLAVSEDFGGWAAVLELPKVAGVRVIPAAAPPP